MSEALKKDLNYYLTHTDEMPTDPKVLEDLANEHRNAAMESGTQDLTVESFVGEADTIEGGSATAKDAGSDAKTETTPPAAKVEATTTASPAADKADDDKGREQRPDGILTKDGKQVIPYSQLESARSRATAAEALVKQQADELAALRGKVDTARKGSVDSEVEMLTDDELDALEAESPTLAKTLRATQAQIARLTDTINSLSTSEQRRIVLEQDTVKSEVQEAIDGNTVLASWQTAEDKTAWDRAIAIDTTIREMPEYANVSFADRFNTVVELTAKALKIELTPETPAKVDETPALTQEQIRSQAAAKLQAKQKAAIPRSLSDIPGGAPPAVDERQKVEEMSAVALGQQFMNMNKDQMEAYLSTL